MRHKNIIIIGTSHIAPESLHEVERVIRKEQPGIVAVELDQKRLAALLHPQKYRVRAADIRRVGVKGWLFSIIGAWVEKQLGRKVGVSPGAEMLKAVRLAQEYGSKVALIDQDIEVTLRRFSQALSWKEKLRLIGDVLKGVITREPEVEFDLARVPPKKTIGRLLARVRRRYPNIYRVLVTERNRVMGKRIAHIITHYPDETIVAVVGAGHEDDILRIVKQELYLYSKKPQA